jgi:hypothetical protein
MVLLQMRYFHSALLYWDPLAVRNWHAFFLCEFLSFSVWLVMAYA